MQRQWLDFNQKISLLFPKENAFKGEVGIEVEVEGNLLPRVMPSYWKVVPDHSLRGESAEYVLKQPCRRGSVLKICQYLKKKLDENGAIINQSNRTSVHVHVNMSQYTLRELFQVVVLYMIFEELLVNIAGPERVGNLFCLRCKDAEFFLDYLANMAAKRKFYVDPEKLRYTALNVCAVEKFGSLEFRALRGTVAPDVISEWVQLLLKIKDAALRYASPAQILQEFSGAGPMMFIQSVFGDDFRKFTDQPDWQESLWEGARLAQDVAFATDWDKDMKPRRVFLVDDYDEDF